MALHLPTAGRAAGGGDPSIIARGAAARKEGETRGEEAGLVSESGWWRLVAAARHVRMESRASFLLLRRFDLAQEEGSKAANAAKSPGRLPVPKARYRGVRPTERRLVFGRWSGGGGR